MSAENRKSQLINSIDVSFLDLAPTRKTYLKNQVNSFVELEILYLLAKEGIFLMKKKREKNALRFSAISPGTPVRT